MGDRAVKGAVLQIARLNTRNCVTEWLASLVWNKEPRIDHFFEDHFGVAATEYSRAVSKNFWISIVARAFSPGCKCDTMIVLEGAQGIFKSTALQIIGGEWFCEQHESAADPKAFAEIIQGVLLTEISEMDAFNKAEVSRVKQVLSTRSDRYRVPFETRASSHPRQGILAATTNKDGYNKDETGARRFWPLACKGPIDVAAIARWRDQFFAEAVVRFKAGETWWEMPEEETRAEQNKRYDEDVWTDKVAEFIEGRPEVTIMEILTDCLKLRESEAGGGQQMRLGRVLTRLGWGKADRWRNKRVVKVWSKKGEQ